MFNLIFTHSAGSFDNTVAVWDMSDSITNGLKKSPFKNIQSIPFPNTPLCIKVRLGSLVTQLQLILN